VLEFLQRAGSDASRPDNLGEEFGLKGDVYHLSPVQAQAILDLRLHRLTGMEYDKLLEEYQQKLEQIGEWVRRQQPLKTKILLSIY